MDRKRSAPSSKGIGRPPRFEESEAVRAAMDVFWSAGTSP